MVKEISMLQLEISRLRSRFKALDEAMLSQKADNAKMIVESAPTSLIGEGGTSLARCLFYDHCPVFVTGQCPQSERFSTD